MADTVTAGREAGAALLDTAQPSAIVCASDTLAVGVLHTLAERGLHPGRDVAVVGFDDSQVAQVVPGGLTSVRQPLEQVALELVRALEALLAREPCDGAGVLLAPTLAVRARPVDLRCGGSCSVDLRGRGSEVLRPEVDRVVDLEPVVVAQDLVGDLAA